MQFWEIKSKGPIIYFFNGRSLSIHRVSCGMKRKMLLHYLSNFRALQCILWTSIYWQWHIIRLMPNELSGSFLRYVILNSKLDLTFSWEFFSTDLATQIATDVRYLDRKIHNKDYYTVRNEKWNTKHTQQYYNLHTYELEI